MNAESARWQMPRVLLARLGGQVVALPVGREGGRVVEIGACTRVPTGPDHLLGLANDQGRVLAILDVRRLLGLPQPPWSQPLLAQVVCEESMRTAVAVEEVLGLEFWPPPGPEAVRTPAAELWTFALGPLRLASGDVPVLDVPRIIERLKISRHKQS